MFEKIIGQEGEYLIKNESSILQYKFDDKGNCTGESVVHIITDSIENNYDRNQVSEIIKEYSFH